MAKYVGYKRPKDTKKTMKRLLSYLAGHKLSMLAVTVLVIISSMANIMGTYLLKPVINDYIVPRDVPGLLRMVLLMGLVYLAGALATYG